MRLLPKLPRIGLPKRGARADSAGPAKNGTPKNREEALKMMRARVTGEVLAPAPAPVAALPISSAPAPQPAPAAGTPPETPAADPLKAISEAADTLDSDLLDIFIEAKAETEESSLAASVEEVHISDLLGEVLQVGRRLGVHAPAPTPRAERTAAPPEPAAAAVTEQAALGHAAPGEPAQSGSDAPAANEEPPGAATASEDVPLPAEEAEPHQPEVHVLPAGPDPEAQAPVPAEAEEDPIPPVRRVEAQDPGALKMVPRRDLHGRYLAIVAAFGLGLALMTSYGITLAKEGAGAAPSDQTAVLSLVALPETPAVGTARVLRSEPVVPQVGEAAAYVPPAAAIPQSAGRQPGSSSFDADGPAFFRYTVESGDSLTSIANQFQICPDHILWNNENTGESLRAGDELLLPGYPGLLHEMRKGEKLDEVASRYNTTAAKVIAYPGNHLKSAEDAKEHTLILLPGGFPSSALADTAEGAATYRPPSEYGYTWPFFGPITTLFGEPRPGYIHTAIDIGGLGRWGAPVSASAAGRVIQVEHLQNGLGNYVVIEHPDGSRSLYAHLAETWVEPGDTLQQGAHVGPVGCTGLSTGTHLHFQLWRDGKPVDPLLYLPLLDAGGQSRN